MSHGLSRKIKKIARFLDSGGVILRIKLKDKHYSLNVIQKFHEVDINKKPIIKVWWTNGWDQKGWPVVWNHGSYRKPVINLSVKNWGSDYYKDPYINVHWAISDIRYMLVKYPDGLIKTIWL